MKLKEWVMRIWKSEKEKPTQYQYVSGKGKEYFLKDGGTRPLKITIGEAYLILNGINEGKSLSQIYRDIDWHHVVSESAVRTFVKNYRQGMFEDALRRIK